MMEYDWLSETKTLVLRSIKLYKGHGNSPNSVTIIAPYIYIEYLNTPECDIGEFITSIDFRTYPDYVEQSNLRNYPKFPINRFPL